MGQIDTLVQLVAECFNTFGGSQIVDSSPVAEALSNQSSVFDELGDVKSKLKYRCGRGGCRKIYHLTKPPECYKVPKTCICGGKLHDYTYERNRNRIKKCNCDGWPFPHQIGSSVWRKHHPTGPTNNDYEERYGPC